MTTTESITLDTDNEVTLPVVELLTGRGFITGKSGSGKSNSASVVVEELLDQSFPVLIVDTDGEYWGLKEEYEILHVGADEECDLQVGPEHAEKLAELALEKNVPIILDVSGYLNQEEADALVRETARELFAKEKKLNKPFLVLVEEVHEYIPEGGGMTETGEMLVRIGKRGRKRGLGLVGISQRPADVKKDFITQCDWLLWHRLTWENDTQVVKRVVNKATADAVSELDDGEAFLMADFLDTDIQRVQIRRKRTFDAGATPDLGEFERPDLKNVGSDLVGELEEISSREAKRQDRISELEAQLEARDEEIQELENELEQARDMTSMAEQFTQALTQSADSEGGGGEALQAKVEEIREEKNSRITELESENESLREELQEIRAEKVELEERVGELEEYEQAVEHMDELREGIRRMADALGITVNGGNEKLRQRLEKKTDRIQSLEQELERARAAGGDGVEVPGDYEDFLQDPIVREQIEAAKEASAASPRYVKGVLATILQERGAVTYDEISDRLGVSTNTDVGKAATELESRRVIKSSQDGRKKTVDLNIEGIRDVKEAKQRREQTEAVMDSL